jgi:hypothetical protein
VSISVARFRRGGEKKIRALRAMIEEDTMNPMYNWAIVAERMQALAAEAGTAARARQARRVRRALAVAGAGRRHPRSTVRGNTLKAGEAL